MHPDSGVEVHSSRRWQKSGFAQKKTRSTGSEAICRNGLYAPTAADALCVGPHKANNFPRPAPDSRGVLFELQLEASFAALDRDQAQQRCELLLVLRRMRSRYGAAKPSDARVGAAAFPAPKGCAPPCQGRYAEERVTASARFCRKPSWALALRAVCCVMLLAKGINHSLRRTPCIPSRKAKCAAMWDLIRGSLTIDDVSGRVGEVHVIMKKAVSRRPFINCFTSYTACLMEQVV